MGNITKERREKLLSYIEQLKKQHSDDNSIAALNELENQLTQKKFGLVFEEHTEQADEMLEENIPVLVEDKERRICKDASSPWNFVIEGDNLHALYLLEKTHKGKIDCIYIDPPYNTGARDWKYNNDYVDKEDTYRHSKWLSLMKKRLVAAKKLLNPAGSILIVTIDDKEYLHLGCLLEELFPSAKMTMISSVINPAGKAKKGGVDFSRVDEYIYFLQIGDMPVLTEIRDSSKTPISWETFRRHSKANGRGKHGVGACGPNQFYPIYINNVTKEIVEFGEPIMEDVDRFSVKQIEGCSTVFPVRDNGIEMNWAATRDTAMELYKKGYLRVGNGPLDKPQQFIIKYLTKGVIKDIEAGKVTIEGVDDEGFIQGYYMEGRAKVPTTAWNKASNNATSYGTDLLSKIFVDERFTYPKSLYAVIDCLDLFLRDKKDAVILDFFAGSGTTLHAVTLMNAIDSGKRKCIVVTNNEVGAEDEKRFTELGIKKGDKEWEDRGIAKYVTWERVKSFITGKDVFGNPLVGEYGATSKEFEPCEVEVFNNGKTSTKTFYKQIDKQLYPSLSTIKMKDGFCCNAKYFKCDWIDRRPEEYLLSNALCLHIKEMIELQTFSEVDGEKQVIILNHDDYKKVFVDGNPDSIETIWINQNILFTTEEMQNIKKHVFKYIPKEYFSQELKEVGEYV